MLKQLDKCREIQLRIESMETNKDIRDYIELKKVHDALRSSLRQEPNSHVFAKENSLGIRQSLKTCESLIGLDLSNDKRTLRGIMQGEKVNAHFTLTHRKPFIVQATPSLEFKGGHHEQSNN
jgi:hypothetical protein